MPQRPARAAGELRRLHRAHIDAGRLRETDVEHQLVRAGIDDHVCAHAVHVDGYERQRGGDHEIEHGLPRFIELIRGNRERGELRASAPRPSAAN